MIQVIFRQTIGVLLLTALAIPAVQAQVDTTFRREPLAFAAYLGQVGQQNLSYASQQFNVDVAQAAIAQARIFPDPTLGVGYFNNGQRRLQTGYGFLFQYSQTLELGGKRRARIHLAQSQTELAQATLLDFFRLLRADATLGFLEGIHRQRIFQIQQMNYRYLVQLAEANQKRNRLGTLSEVDAIQSRVEADNALNSLIQAEADWKTALIALGQFRSGLPKDTLYQPVGDLSRFDRTFALEPLIIQAQNTRADLLAARQGQDVAQKALQLARANRMIDLGLSLSNNYVSRITNIIEPTPSYNTLSAGIAIPLKFSNRYNSDIRIARLQSQQADLAYRQVEVQIRVEVTQAFEQYGAARRQIQQFNNDLLTRAQRVLEGRIYSYNRGESSLLEVLAARQTFNQLQLAYTEALITYASALVNLERTAGIWDIDF
ncbi:TolC family protein [Siphonobacter sp. SORGH_AS_0500]|uniref:TolC family protein n=1 Tax=Siphonobacter sp. SORGH_AS_0500 TaxID=1864824 RepID=UPI000CAC5185|nr:TolC family protein [Siphonobacter sp. SORGH_AS_0500]MDR6197498.1 cobalt-zinc-cadmium efflux system outer membrane protein [Siphonobacter sp. SORGH_AS_0500]PKK34771.1 hypothetical protein BWI96_20580 [Siphonobacter sp. SORGH_AS_0500]